ncbi:MAG TPA: histone deacetylase [Armatimonadetes bacterium]|nr:histone deacetylase [Armatimonadota bacterium]
MPTGFVYHEDYLQHYTGAHPERAERLRAIVEGLQEAGLWEQLTHLPPRAAKEEEVTLVHHPAYLCGVKTLAERGGGMLDPDTVVSDRSYEVALLAVGGALTAVEAVLQGKVQNAFAAVRPPGHHARPQTGMGFCLLNNLAIAAQYARQQGMERIFIVDWDVHHGNGVQEVFYEDPQVFYFSLHQYPWYPGTGRREERGRGAGEGTTYNVPLTAGCGDGEYERVFVEELSPLMRAFQPELVLIAAGMDAHADDPLAFMQVSTAGFGRLARRVLELAGELCAGRVVALLEGGYNLRALSESVNEIVRRFLAADP